jgi:hypothetical protein
MFFSTLPTVADAFQLTVWRGGPDAGKPKLPPVAKELVEQGLMWVDTDLRLPRLFFTDAGLARLRTMMANRRLPNPNSLTSGPEFGIDPE